MWIRYFVFCNSLILLTKSMTTNPKVAGSTPAGRTIYNRLQQIAILLIVTFAGFSLHRLHREPTADTRIRKPAIASRIPRPRPASRPVIPITAREQLNIICACWSVILSFTAG